MTVAGRIEQLRNGGWPCCLRDPESGGEWFEPGEEHEPLLLGLGPACLPCTPMVLRTAAARLFGLEKLPSPCECIRRKPARRRLP
jgi:hypothetical protein